MADNSKTQELLKQHHDECFRWALYCSSGDKFAAEDLIQTVYLKVLEGKATYNENSETSFRTWIFSVIKFTGLDHYKAEKKYVFTENAVDVETDVQADTEEENAENSEREMLIKKLLSKLSPKQNEVLRLVFYHNMTIEEAAGIMNVTIGTARTHYERGKSNLRQLIDEPGMKLYT
ncbi:MAG: RNA polymerase sigma factor [Balneolaceae bacterium]